MSLFPDEALTPRPRGVRPPLAERMRPRTLAEFYGQEHLLGPDGPFGLEPSGRATLGSLILWGPPGSGKTTLAHLLAARAGLHVQMLSAVRAGVREVRDAIDAALRLRQRGVSTALLIDEIHRFNKAQQDALLPHVERGDVVLIGATTENPSFEVIPALRSRAPVFRLHAHTPDTVRRILDRALVDTERGVAPPRRADPDALDLIASLSDGDARRALTLLERAAARADGPIDRALVVRVVGERVPDHDKSGDAHYDVVSAFIKSMRGSDPDAAIYWLARMLEGGEDPRYICRRMIVFASEDVGNADPAALGVAVAAAEAFERVGLPEGRIPLAQAATYLASTAKSNASYRALLAAEAAVRETGGAPVPLHLRNAPTQLLREQGHGEGYLYPHDFPEHYVAQQYLPDVLRDTTLYRPTDQGAEADLRRRLERLRAAHRDR